MGRTWNAERMRPARNAKSRRRVLCSSCATSSRRPRSPVLQTGLPPLEGPLKKLSHKGVWQKRYFVVRARDVPLRAPLTSALLVAATTTAFASCRRSPWYCVRRVALSRPSPFAAQANNEFLNYYSDDKKKQLLAAINLANVRRPCWCPRRNPCSLRNSLVRVGVGPY
jgi:hypothetical protein